VSKFNVICFTLYSVDFEVIVWGGWFWIVFVLDKSAWWTLLAIVLSGAQLKGSSFGIDALRSGEAVATPPPDMVTVPREHLAEWITAMRCSEPYVACGCDNTQKRLDAIESMARALRSGDAEKRVG
jgi:hypothetical protein